MHPSLKKLKKYFQNEPQAILAFLFGSFAKDCSTDESDIDLAVYLKDNGKGETIRQKIAKLLKKDFDFIYLDQAPATLVSNILKTGIPFAIKDKKLYWKLYLEKSLEAEDFLDFAKGFYRIYKKSRSLIPEEKVRLLERVQFLDSELEELDVFKKITFEDYRTDKSKRRNIERWTENIINAMIDISKIVLASEKKQMPKTYEEVLSSLALFTGLSENQAGRFSRIARLRNILAHEYLDILYQQLRGFIKIFPSIYKHIWVFLQKYLE